LRLELEIILIDFLMMDLSIFVNLMMKAVIILWVLS